MQENIKIISTNANNVYNSLLQLAKTMIFAYFLLYCIAEN